MFTIKERMDLTKELSDYTQISYYRVSEILRIFDKPPRNYHNSNHILDLTKKILNDYHDKTMKRILLTISLFHDYVYDPKSKTNEEDSAKVFYDFACENFTENHPLVEHIMCIKECILDTKNHIPTNPISNLFCAYDLSSFDDTWKNVLESENRIRKEYEWVDWSDYKKGKIQFLNKYLDNSIIKQNTNSIKNIKKLIEHIEIEKPRIAVYAGSFNPFTIGHLNILEKSRKIFDKVIIAFGNNPEKPRVNKEIPQCLKYKQVDEYSGSLLEYIDSKSYDITLIRGLRNSIDFQYELNQHRWIQEIRRKQNKNDISIISIFCDNEFEHISSSNIKALYQFDDLEKYANDFIVK